MDPRETIREARAGPRAIPDGNRMKRRLVFRPQKQEAEGTRDERIAVGAWRGKRARCKILTRETGGVWGSWPAWGITNQG